MVGFRDNIFLKYVISSANNFKMKKNKIYLLMKISSLAIVLTSLMCCKKTASEAQNINNIKTVNYTAIATDFPNPERGFYRYSEVKASNFISLNIAELKSYRSWVLP